MVLKSEHSVALGLKESISYANTQAPKKGKLCKQKWMTTEILELMKERKASKNKPNYDSLDKRVKKECREAKEYWIDQKCTAIEESNRNNGTKKVHADIKDVCGTGRKKQSSGCIRSKDGKVIFEKDEVRKRWAEYVGDLFADTRPAMPVPTNNEGPPIIQSEVRKALKDSQIGKAPGEDGITTEMLKQLEEFGIEKLTELYNEMYSTGHIPKDSLFQTISHYPKKLEAPNVQTLET